DPANPDVRSLSLGESIQFAVGGETASGFAEAKQDKLALASQVTELAQSFDDRAQVEPTLNALEDAVENGSVAESAAVDAVDRLKFGENVTEYALAGAGPKVPDPSGEDGDTRVGIGGPAYNIAGNTVQIAISLATELLLGALALGKVRKIIPGGSKINKASGIIDDLAQDLSSYLLGKFDDLQRLVIDESLNIRAGLRSVIVEGGKTDGTFLFNQLINDVTDIRTGLANFVVSQIETGPVGEPLADEVAQLDEAVVGDGQPSLSGSQSAAEDAGFDGISRIDDVFETASRNLSTIQTANTVVGFLGLAATVLTATGILGVVGSALAFLATLFAISAGLVGTATGIFSLLEVTSEHADALENVVAGEVN
ncbi:MAG: hypothetical protein ABEI99_05700, partial [Halobaculum sp.]